MSPKKKQFRTTESFKEELLLKNEAYANGEFEIVSEVSSDDRKYIYKLEKQYKRDNKDMAYMPKINFDGSKSECFKTIKN